MNAHAMAPIQYKPSPLADAFPLIEGDEFDELVADIAENGLQFPIVLNEANEILDGRNRYRACLAAGVQARFEVQDGDYEEQKAFVISANLLRRHLNESQRAMIAARLMIRDGTPRSNVGFEKAANPLRVSSRSVQTAVKVIEQAPPAIQAMVDRGEVSVSKVDKVLSGDIPADALLEDGRRRAGRPKGNRHVNTLLAMIDDAVRLSPFEAVIITNWSPDKATTKKLEATVMFLRSVLNQVRDLERVAAGTAEPVQPASNS